jgi:hypothetical protein
MSRRPLPNPLRAGTPGIEGRTPDTRPREDYFAAALGGFVALPFNSITITSNP